MTIYLSRMIVPFAPMHKNETVAIEVGHGMSIPILETGIADASRAAQIWVVLLNTWCFTPILIFNIANLLLLIKLKPHTQSFVLS